MSLSKLDKLQRATDDLVFSPFPVNAMSHAAEASTAGAIDDTELAASNTPGYKVGQARALSAYAELDKDDDALNRWKASLGVTQAGGGQAGATKPKVSTSC